MEWSLNLVHLGLVSKGGKWQRFSDPKEWVANSVVASQVLSRNRQVTLWGPWWPSMVPSAIRFLAFGGTTWPFRPEGLRSLGCTGLTLKLGPQATVFTGYLVGPWDLGSPFHPGVRVQGLWPPV